MVLMKHVYHTTPPPCHTIPLPFHPTLCHAIAGQQKHFAVQIDEDEVSAPNLDWLYCTGCTARRRRT